MSISIGLDQKRSSKQEDEEAIQWAQDCLSYVAETVETRTLIALLHDEDELELSKTRASRATAEWQSIVQQKRQQQQQQQLVGASSGQLRSRQLGAQASRRLSMVAKPVPAKSSSSWTFSDDISFKINKLTLGFFSQLGNLDMLANDTRSARDDDQGTANCANQPGNNLALMELKVFKFATIGLWSYNRVERSNWYKSSRRLWHRLISLLFLFSCCHMIFYLVHQYRYDYYKLRLRRVRWLNQTQPRIIIEKQNLEHEDYLMANIGREFEQLTSMGAPHIHLSFVIEYAYLLILLVGLFSFIALSVYFNYRSTFKLHLIRSLLAGPDEQKVSAGIISQQVRWFIESSQNYHLALQESRNNFFIMPFQNETASADSVYQHQKQQMVADSKLAGLPTYVQARKQSPTTTTTATLTPPPPSTSGLIVHREHLSLRQLQLMVERNQLRPMNQSDKWIRSQSRFYCMLFSLSIVYGVLIELSLINLMIATRDTSNQLNWKTWIVSGELILSTTLLGVIIVLYSTSLVLTCIDESKLANKLRKVIECTINLNNLRFYNDYHLKTRMDNIRLACGGAGGRNSIDWRNLLANRIEQRKLVLLVRLASSQEKLNRLSYPDSHANSMNNSILLAFMHYKIFVAHLMAQMNSLRAIAMTTVLIMFIMPIMSRLHLPYYDRDQHQNMRLLAISFSCIPILPFNICMLPLCNLNKRCLDLYCQLNSLLAHATDIINQPNGRNVYDRHIISMLHKELCHPDRAAARFSIKFLGLSFTYSSLVKMHFYFGFILLSILADDQTAQKDVSSALFSDPFGLL